MGPQAAPAEFAPPADADEELSYGAQGDYFLQQRGKAFCPAGTRSIDSYAECSHAAKLLGLVRADSLLLPQCPNPCPRR